MFFFAKMSNLRRSSYMDPPTSFPIGMTSEFPADQSEWPVRAEFQNVAYNISQHDLTR